MAQVNTQDSLALVDLYNSTSGPNWTNKTGWLTKPVGTWYGITVAGNRVTEINLQRNNLNGTLPSSLGNLSAIKSLVIRDNYVVGTNISIYVYGAIPASLGQLSNLVTLSLEGNGLTGGIPSSLGNLANLQTLDLQSNYSLGGTIASSLGQLNNLVTLYLSDCNLNGNLPANIVNLPNIKIIDIEFNALSGSIPDITIPNSQLEYFDLGVNNFSGRIPPLYSLPHIKGIDFSYNQLTGSVPASIGQLNTLIGLTLNNNQLSDSIPATLLQLNNLQSLLLSNNLFTFAGIESIAARFGNSTTDYSHFNYYANQAVIPISLNAGKLSVSVGGNVANETFTWYKDGVVYKTVVGDSTLPITANGTYYVVVTNKVAIELTLTSKTIYANSLIITTAYTNATCSKKNGSITATGSGGTQPYQYAINAASFQSSNIFTGLAAGNYTVTIKDALGLTSTASGVLTTTISPAVNLGADTALCQGLSVQLNAPSTVGNLYKWQDGSTASSLIASATGVYWVSVTNASNCSAADTIQVQFNALPNFTLGSDTTLCKNKQLLYQFNLLNASYLWNDGSTTGKNVVTQQGVYWLKVTQGGCAKSDTIIVNFKPSPVVDLGNDTTLCTGTHKNLSAYNSNSFTSYLWQDGLTTATYLVNKAGLYSVIVALDGCSVSDSINITYHAVPYFTLGPDTTLCQGAAITLAPTLNTVAKYLWQDGSTSAAYTIQATGTYYVTASNECGAFTDSVIVGTGICNLNMPTAFTPNQDGLNDVFKVKYYFPVKEFKMMVYDRWGQKVYESTDITKGWSGKQGGMDKPAGTYIWTIRLIDLAGKLQQAQGSVLLIR